MQHIVQGFFLPTRYATPLCIGIMRETKLAQGAGGACYEDCCLVSCLLPGELLFPKFGCCLTVLSGCAGGSCSLARPLLLRW